MKYYELWKAIKDLYPDSTFNPIYVGGVLRGYTVSYNHESLNIYFNVKNSFYIGSLDRFADKGNVEHVLLTLIDLFQ